MSWLSLRGGTIALLFSPEYLSKYVPSWLFKKSYLAFANWLGGDILLFGMDEDVDFKVLGVGNPQELQEDLSDIASHMVAAPRILYSL
jgi:hypothetical protein